MPGIQLKQFTGTDRYRINRGKQRNGLTSNPYIGIIRYRCENNFNCQRKKWQNGNYHQKTRIHKKELNGIP